MRTSRFSGLLLAAMSLALIQCNVVEPLATDPDLQAAAVGDLPSTVTDLSVPAVTDSSVTLSFTEVDDGTGQPASYVVVHSAPPLGSGPVTMATRGSCATPVAGTAISSTRTCTVAGLSAHTSYVFLIVAFRGTPDVDAVFGTFSSAVEATTAAATVTKPGAVTDLAVSGTTDSSVTLSFTEVDNGAGQPASYDIRFATPALAWWAGTGASRGTCASPLKGTAIGAKRSCVLAGLQGATPYQFQMVAFRGTLDVDAVFGPLSNVAGATTGTVVTQPAPVATVTVTPSAASVTVGQTAAFAATLRDSAGNLLTGRTVTWSSTAPNVATVNANGIASTSSAGTAGIVATSEGKTGQAQLTVAANSGTYVIPDLINNISFENGWDGMTSSGFTQPSNVTRDPTQAYDGSLAVLRELPATTSDVGGGMSFPFYAGSPLGQWNPNPPVPAQTHDRMWARFYFYFEGVPNTPFKFQLWWGAGFNEQFGGFYVDESGRLGWLFIEWLYQSGGTIYPLVDLHTLERGWHSIEVDYWRNGDPSGYPSAGLWLDNVQLRGGVGNPGGGGYWDANGRLNAGSRHSSSPLGAYNMLGILNKNNTSPGRVWIDRVALSSLGRIGP